MITAARVELLSADVAYDQRRKSGAIPLHSSIVGETAGCSPCLQLTQFEMRRYNILSKRTNPNALTFPSQLSFLGSLIEAAPWQTRLMPTSYREDTFICLPPSTICPIFSDSAYIRQGVGQNKHWGHSKLIVQNCANLSTLRSLTLWWMSLHWLRRNSCSRSCTQRVHMFLLN